MNRLTTVIVLVSLMMSAVALSGCDAGHGTSSNGSHDNSVDQQSDLQSEPSVVELTPEELEILLSEFTEVAEEIADEAERYRPGLREVTDGVEELAVLSVGTWQRLLEIGFVPPQQIDDQFRHPAWLREALDD